MSGKMGHSLWHGARAPADDAQPRKRRRYLLGRLLAVAALGLLLAAAIPTATPQSASYVKRASSAIAISDDGSRLLVANPDSNTVTLLDPLTGEKLAELAVGVDPRTVALGPNSRAYVANRGAGTVTVLDLTGPSVIATLPVGRQPYGVIASADGAFVFVANTGDDTVSVIDAAALRIIAAIPVRDRPAGLAVTATRLYVTHLLTGLVSVLEISGLPGAVPYCGSMDFDADGDVDPADIGYASDHWSAACRESRYSPAADLDHDCRVSIAEVLAVAQRVGPATCTVISTGSTSNLAQSIVIDPWESFAYMPHVKSNAANPAPLFDTSIFPVVSVIDLADNQHLPTSRISLDSADVPVNMPFDLAIRADYQQMWVLNAGSNDISVLDMATGFAAGHVRVGTNPRGIVLAPDDSRAYVNNTLDGTVSVIDTASLEVTAVITSTQLPLPPILLRGKRLFHSAARADLARDQWISCAACHFDAETDGRTWRFAGLGPRNTPSLLGVIQTYPINWQADMDETQDQEHFIRSFQAGTGLITTGNPYPGRGMFNVGRALDLDALATFVDSLPPAVSRLTGAAPPEVERGRLVFESPATQCAVCHPAPFYTDRHKHDVGTADSTAELAGRALDTPTLRGLPDTAPYLHDGSAPTLYDVLVTKNAADRHGVTSHLTGQELADLIAFLEALPY